jgi:cobalt/nickel transport system permease protein
LEIDMHMADALLSPAVGGTMWAATAGMLVYSARRVRAADDDRVVPLMGVLGAFVFAAQMINFGIPGTGSSGHIGGGMLLSILIGPAAAFVTIASVLTIQALFFADGGLLALGANIFNLGFFPCVLAYPLIYRPMVRGTPSAARLSVACLLSTVVGLQLGALGVVVETVSSGISNLPLRQFLWLMQPIHLAIGLVEGAATAAIVLFVRRARPDLLDLASAVAAKPERSNRPLIVGFAIAAALTGGVLSWFASTNPDGLEWSVAAVAGGEPEGTADRLHAWLAKAQHAVAWLPDYEFATSTPASNPAPAPVADRAANAPTPMQTPEAWRGVSAGRSLSGVLGGSLVLALVLAFGLVLRRVRR